MLQSVKRHFSVSLMIFNYRCMVKVGVCLVAVIRKGMCVHLQSMWAKGFLLQIKIILEWIDLMITNYVWHILIGQSCEVHRQQLQYAGTSWFIKITMWCSTISCSNQVVLYAYVLGIMSCKPVYQVYLVPPSFLPIIFRQNRYLV